MKNNDYLQNLSAIDEYADKHNDLFHRGKFLFETLERLEKEGDKLEMEEFFIGLSLVEENALRYVVDENNGCVDKFSKLLSNGDNEKAIDFYNKTPRLYQKNLESLYLQHVGQNHLTNNKSAENSSSLHSMSVQNQLLELKQPEVRQDFESYFNHAVPENEPYYRHLDEGSDDLPAHLKASILGCSLNIPIRSGRPDLGLWQGIYLCEHRNYGGGRT